MGEPAVSFDDVEPESVFSVEVIEDALRRLKSGDTLPVTGPLAAFEDAYIPTTWRERLYGRDDARAFIIGNRLCATTFDRSRAWVGRAA